MTSQVIVSIRDKKADTYSRPFTCPSIGTAIRTFSDEVQRSDQTNHLHNHPSDFTLYHLGMFNEDTGVIEAFTQPKLIIEADQCTKPN